MDSEPYSLFILIFSWTTTIRIILLLFLLTLSALISGVEVAFFSLSRTQINEISEKTKGKDIVVKLLKNPKKLLGTVVIVNNFINILIVLLFASLDNIFFAGLSKTVTFLIEIVLITFLILLFGEVLPKVYASKNAIKFANFMAKPVYILNIVLTPLNLPLINLTNFIETKLGRKKNNLSVEKLSQALELTSDRTTTKNEQKILQGIVSFGNTETVQIMKPRIDIFALSNKESYQEVLKKILKNGYSRNPVYNENIDAIIGILYTKDLLAHLNKKQFEWQKLLRKPFFVPENKKLDDLLIQFKDKKNHLAIVVDEYGGTSGIVTLEDVIEEIVGDINEDFDEVDLLYSKIDDNHYMFDGKITIKDFCRVFKEINEEKFDQEKGESETLAGFILEIFGKFPKKNEKIKFQNYTFTVESLDRKRIKQIKVSRNV